MSVREQQQARYTEQVEKIPSIKLLSFDVDTSWIADLLYGKEDLAKRISIIDRRNTTQQQQIDWIINILKDYQIENEYLFGFAGLPIARVKLSGEYEWVGAIWESHHSMRFVPPDNMFCLFIKWTERCLGDNCYEAFILFNKLNKDL